MDQLVEEGKFEKTQTTSPKESREHEEVKLIKESNREDETGTKAELDNVSTILNDKLSEGDEVERQAVCELNGEIMNTGQSDEDEEREVMDTDSNTVAVSSSYEYCTEENPKLVAGSWCSLHTEHRDNYFKGCKWSPDGSCILACSNDCSMRLFNLPTELYATIGSECMEMTPAVSVKEGELVYDYTWYPHMSSYDPATCCFASCSRAAPIHLWDAYTGQLRASYVAYNHLDEVVAPYSISFNSDGTNLYAGLRNMVKVFDSSRPGRECTTLTTYKKSNGGQRGMISCIAPHPLSADTYALGSYSCSVALYSDQVQGAICVFSDLQSGVTHLTFSPCGNFLFSGERKSQYILCWDLRNPGTILQRFERTVSTNQRIYFDIDRSGCNLMSGSTDGIVSWWDLRQPYSAAEESEEDFVTSPVSAIKCHNDAVNGCNLHPVLPLLATTSGQWTFPITPDSEDEDHSEQKEEQFENTLKIWSLQGQRTGPYSTITNEH